MKILLATFSILFFIASAEARNFYTSTASLKLTHSSVSEGTRTIGRAQARVVFSDDLEFCEFTVKEKTYSCNETDRTNRFFTYITFPDTVLKDALNLSDEAYQEIHLPGRFSYNLKFRRSLNSARRYLGFNKKKIIQLHTDRNDESYHLIVKPYKPRRIR